MNEFGCLSSSDLENVQNVAEFKKKNLELSKVEQFSTGLHCKSGKENYFPLFFLGDICQLEPQQKD